MSIYISSMELPKVGKSKTVTIYDDGAVCVGALIVGRAIELPEHGDLIDRQDAIVDANERAYYFWNCDADVDSTIQFLNEQHTIISASGGET